MGRLRQTWKRTCRGPWFGFGGNLAAVYARARVRVVVFLVLLSFFASVRRSVERVFERGPREKVGIVGSRRRGGTTFERDCACDFFGWAVPKPQKRKEDIYVWPLSFRASMEWRFQSASWRRGLV